MVPLLDRLNASFNKVPDHGHAGQPAHNLDGLQARYEELYVLHLLCRWKRIPTHLQCRRAPNIGWQRRARVGDVEPPVVPALQGVPRRESDILVEPLFPHLNRRTTDHDRPGFLPGRYLKKIAKEGKMGPNPQICLTEMDEGGNIKNGVRI